MNIEPGLIAAVAIVLAGIALLAWYIRRDRRATEAIRQGEAGREKRRRIAMADLDPQGKLLYQLVENTSGLMDVQQQQTRQLDGIRSATVLIAVLLVLSVIFGCLVGVIGWSIPGL
jgi:Flp pilus assembly protein TadB